MKKPWLAGLLNVIPGLGYLYVDTKRVLGWYLVAADVLMIIGSILPSSSSGTYADDAPLLAGDWIFVLGSLVFWVGLIVDGHKAAVIANHKSKS